MNQRTQGPGLRDQVSYFLEQSLFRVTLLRPYVRLLECLDNF